jgi:hypothetical protein
MTDTPNTPEPTLMCCDMACEDHADWVVNWSPDPDDETHACSVHLGQLLGPRQGQPFPDAYTVTDASKRGAE